MNKQHDASSTLGNGQRRNSLGNTVIKGLERLEETTIRAGGNGDNWHMTWADNDKQYVGLCDGTAWENVPEYNGKSYNSRVYGIQGDPLDFNFEHMPGFPDLLIEDFPNCSRYYGFGILALNDGIYQFLSTPNHPFAVHPQALPDPRFVGAKLIYSSDNGQTWKNQNGSPLCWEDWQDRNSENMVFFNEPDGAFSLLTILQMGKNYHDNRDGYVYVYAPNGNSEGTMNQLVMFRVARESILDRQAYEFFAGCRSDGSAEWIKDINARGIVHTFPSGWVNKKFHPYAWHPSVVYNRPLNVYMMANWGMGCSAEGDWFSKPSYLGFWTAPNPWGPWTQIHEESQWTVAGDSESRAYQPQISPKWISADGKSFWLVWTDWFLSGEIRPYYSFNLQKVRIIIDEERKENNV